MHKGEKELISIQGLFCNGAGKNHSLFHHADRNIRLFRNVYTVSGKVPEDHNLDCHRRTSSQSSTGIINKANQRIWYQGIIYKPRNTSDVRK